MDAGDRKMFAPILKGQARSPETAVCDVLAACAAGATAAGLADRLFHSGLVIGVRPSVTKRVTALLEDLEREARVERIPDGRYRVVKAAAKAKD